MNEKSTCPIETQLGCENFVWRHRMKNQHVRLTEVCNNWNGKECELSGRACNLGKIRRLKAK